MELIINAPDTTKQAIVSKVQDLTLDAEIADAKHSLKTGRIRKFNLAVNDGIKETEGREVNHPLLEGVRLFVHPHTVLPTHSVSELTTGNALPFPKRGMPTVEQAIVSAIVCLRRDNNIAKLKDLIVDQPIINK